MQDEGKEQGNWQYQPGTVVGESSAPDSNEAHTDSQSSSGPLQWTASEYIAQAKGSSWFVLLGIGSAVLGLIVYWATRSVISSFAVILVCLSIAVFGARKPQNIPYELDEQGVHVGPRFYPYSQFKSFSVVEEGAIDCIWLRSLKKYQPTVAMYFAPDDEDKIVDFLSEFLPHEEREHDAFDRISRRFRF